MSRTFGLTAELPVLLTSFWILQLYKHDTPLGVSQLQDWPPGLIVKEF